MKKLFALVSFLCIYASNTFGQQKISIDSVMGFVGKNVTVCTNVSGGKAFEKVTLLNLGAKYPNSQLTIAIFSKDAANFASEPLAMYNHKNICVTGKVELYKGKPEIIVNKSADILVENETTTEER